MKQILLLYLLFNFLTGSVAQNIYINMIGIPANNSAILDASSSSHWLKGIIE